MERKRPRSTPGGPLDDCFGPRSPIRWVPQPPRHACCASRPRSSDCSTNHARASWEDERALDSLRPATQACVGPTHCHPRRLTDPQRSGARAGPAGPLQEAHGRGNCAFFRCPRLPCMPHVRVRAPQATRAIRPLMRRTRAPPPRRRASHPPSRPATSTAARTAGPGPPSAAARASAA
jgi:hypothetical protein